VTSCADAFDGRVSQDVDLLIGDADRSSAAAALRGHYEAGRLTVEEFESRLGAVNAARTESDLREALKQLPERTLPSLNPRDRRWSSLVVQYAALNGIAILVWLASGAQSDFWPKWVFVATAILFVRRVVGLPPRHRRRELSRPPVPPDEH
jgi:hypothetical protein